jgi:phosphohistidine phosphatase
MKRIVLVRHATAVDVGPKGSDFHRRLKKRGRRESAIMADRIATTLGTPDLLVTSPADRALETARAFAERLGITAEAMIVREQLYGGLLPDEFLRIVVELEDAHDTVMIVGHDPSFTEFASYMAPEFKESIPKAGVVALDFDVKSWSAVSPGQGVLAAFEKPPSTDVQKRIEEDLLDRLSAEIRMAVFTAVKTFGVPENRDVVKSVARASVRVAKAVRPFAASETAPAKTAAKGPRRAEGKSNKQRRGRSRA